MRPWGSALFCIGLALAAPAQRPEVYTTPDGSRFLLVPMDTHVVHWLNLTPAGLGVEPEAYPGLALAIARASLLGRALPGNTRTKVDTSPLAWERALRAAPSTGSRLVRIDEYLGIHVTFPSWSMGRVAQLIRVRSRRTKLSRLSEHFTQVRRERQRRLAQTAELELIQQALDAADADQKSGAWMRRGSAEHLDLEDAMAFYRWAYHPKQALHVIVGKFQPAAAKNALDVLFDKAVAAAPRPTGKKVEVDRIAPQRRAAGDGVLVVFGAAPHATTATREAAVLKELLAGDEDAFLPDYLRARGHPNCLVEARFTPTRSGRAFLVHVRRPGSKIDAEHRLVADVREALQVFRTKPTTEFQVQRALTAERSAHAARLATPFGLAEHLARNWIATGRPLPELGANGRLWRSPDPSAGALREHAGQLWPKEKQAILTEGGK